MHGIVKDSGSLLTGVLAAAIVAGCSATGPQFSEQPVASDKALVYIYRPDSGAFKARTLGVDINGARVAGLKNNGFVALDLVPGSHDVKLGWDLWIGDGAIDRPILGRIAVKAGTKTYLRFATSSTTAPGTKIGTITQTMRWGLQPVPADVALPEISQTKQVELERSPPVAPAAESAPPAASTAEKPPSK